MHVKFWRTDFRYRQITTYSRTIWEETYSTLPVLEEKVIYRTRDGVNVPYISSTVRRSTGDMEGLEREKKKMPCFYTSPAECPQTSQSTLEPHWPFPGHFPLPKPSQTSPHAAFLHISFCHYMYCHYKVQFYLCFWKGLIRSLFLIYPADIFALTILLQQICIRWPKLYRWILQH